MDSLLARAERLLDVDVDAAEGLFREVLSISKNEHRAERGLAIVWLIRADADKAIKRARKAIKKDKRNSEYHMLLANAYGMKAQRGGLNAMFYGGKYKKECELAIKYDPENVDAHFGLLYYYAYAPSIAGGGEKKAAEAVRAIASLDPFAGAIAEAFWAEQNEDDATAEAGFRAFIEAGEEHGEVTVASAHWRLGHVLEKAGRLPEAVIEWETAVSLDAEHERAREALARAAESREGTR